MNGHKNVRPLPFVAKNMHERGATAQGSRLTPSKPPGSNGATYPESNIRSHNAMVSTGMNSLYPSNMEEEPVEEV